MHARPNKTNAGGRARRRRAGGFTLVEVMFALGILGFALPMVAAALLSGMVENKESVDNTMSTLLAENAIAVLRCRVRHSDLMTDAPAGWGPNGMASFQQLPAGLIHADDLVYHPFGEDEFRTKFACVIVGQRMGDNLNDYRFAALVYRKLADTDPVTEAKLTFSGNVVDMAETYVRLQSSAADQSAMISYYMVRMALKP